jgi:hypothetical protein
MSQRIDYGQPEPGCEINDGKSVYFNDRVGQNDYASICHPSRLVESAFNLGRIARGNCAHLYTKLGRGSLDCTSKAIVCNHPGIR